MEMKGKYELMEKYTVSLDDFIRYLMKKWIIIVACIVLGVVSFVLSASLLGEKIVIPQSEKYASLKEEEAAFEKYIANAPLMKMDSTNIYERILYLSNITNREALKNFVDAGVAWENWSDENFKVYFSDHITWKDGEQQSAEVEIWYYDDQECEKLTEYLAEQIKTKDSQVEILLGDPHIINDELTSDTQHWYINRLHAIQGELEHTAAGYTIETSLPIAAVVGAMAGVAAAIVCLFVTFLYREQRKL